MKNLLFLLLASFLATGNIVAQTNPNFVISAHRGNSSEAPENTMSANRAAIAAGADYLECDVRSTRDNVLVTLHDATLNRTTNTRGSLRNYTYANLRNVDAGYSRKFGNRFAGERIPTLQEVLRLAKGKIKVEIEIKENNLADDVVALIKSLNMENEVIVISFKFNEIARVKAIAPNIPVKYLLWGRWGSRELRRLQSIGAEYIGPRGVASASQVSLANRYNVKIISYTIDASNQIRSAIRSGQYGIATNYPRRAVAIRDASKPVSAPFISAERQDNLKSEVKVVNDLAIDSEQPLVYPNPVTNAFFIKTAKPEAATLRLLNSNGQEVRHFGLIDNVNETSFEIPKGAAKGVYILEIKGKCKTSRIRVLVD